jgi:TonB-linked SusC/RagA family outer membrane protein
MMRKEYVFIKKGMDRHKLLRLVLQTGIFVICACISATTVYASYDSSEATQQGVTVTGTVTDEQGLSLPGVNVLEKGTGNGTITNAEGLYTITVEPGATLVISYVGMQTQEIEVGNQTTINIVLSEMAIGMDEVVVIGYGQQSRRTITTAISRVSSDKIEGVPVESVAQALQGKVAGVRIYQSDGGEPGSDATIRIRGGSSINRSNEPLILVDGLPRGLSDINPNDIESVQVLKDASSTAIYGARASNGVILVTTKKGKLGKAEIGFQATVGTATPWKELDLIGSEDFLNLAREALTRSRYPQKLDQAGPAGIGNTESSPWSPRYLQPGQEVPEGWLSMTDPVNPGETIIFQDNDFQDLAYQSGLQQNYYLSANGGSEKIRYSAGVGYTNNEGIGISTRWNRFSGRANVDFHLRDNLVLSTLMDHSSGYSDFYTEQHHMFGRSMWLVPTARVYMDDGSYALGNNASYTVPMWYNDVNVVDRYEYRTHLGSSLNWEIIEGLEAVVTGDYYTFSSTFETFYKANPYAGSRETTFAYDQNKRIQVEGFITYNKTFSDQHHLNVVLGASELYWQHLDTNMEAFGGSTDKIMTLNAAPEKVEAFTYRTEELLIGYFGRINYDFRNKYLLGLSLRRDVSSRFAPENQVGYFPGVSAGWIVSEESFLNDNNLISTLKLRGSWGQTGNNSVGLYDAMGIYSVGRNYGGVAGAFPTAMPNFTLGWETTTQWNVGFDLGLLGTDRIRLLFDYYNKITDDLIFNTPLPNTSGFSSIITNIGSVKFYGFDIEANARVIEGADFSWDMDFNIAFNKNEVLELPDNGVPKNRIGGIYNPDGESFGGIAEGEPMYSTIGYTSVGILDTQEEADNANWDSQARGVDPITGETTKGKKFPGDMEWLDKDGDGVIDVYDQDVLGYLVPNTTGGLANNFRYKNLQLHIFTDYALGHTIMDATIRRGDANAIGGAAVPTTAMLDSWKQEGDAAAGVSMPRFMYHDAQHQKNIHRDNDRAAYRADYLCIREIMLSYNLPSKITSKIRLQSAQVYIQGQNLYYFTEYPGLNPEQLAGNNYGDGLYTIPRKILLGIKLGF